jgi:hypothetical protein
MRCADVLALPVTRDLILRVARAHSDQGRAAPHSALFPDAAQQAAYERAFHEHARQRDMEHAECA